MISNDGIVKLIDFNAAKEFDQSQIEDTRLMGTRKFAAPEQYGFGQSDPRTDLYALGVTMYYLLTKDYPDSGLYHVPLEPVIRKCIALGRSERYPDAAAQIWYRQPRKIQNPLTMILIPPAIFSQNIFIPIAKSFRLVSVPALSGKYSLLFGDTCLFSGFAAP